jgi:hypothetical protein
MSKRKFFLVFIIVLFAALPTAFLLTVAIYPFWNWFEAVTGIESYGHFGPADWCYLFDYGLIVVVSLIVLIWHSCVRKI